MREVGRNDPCPCGSGRKYKRCCLEVERAALRVAAELEERVLELGSLVRDEAGPEWRTAYERHLAPLNRFGAVPAEHAAWLDTWLVCDGPVLGGRTPLEALAVEPQPIDAALQRSSICAWWARGTAFPLPATHWRYEEPLALHSRHEPFGALSDGALLVARGVEVGDAHVALVGRPVVVDDDAIDDVLALLHAAPDQALCAALRWPEVREHTADGDVVQHCSRCYELADPSAAVALLRAAPAVTEDVEAVTYWEDDVAFKVFGPPITEVVEPPHETGVVWELCGADSDDAPLLGELTVSPDDGDLTLSAATRARVERLLAALPQPLRDSLGAAVSEDLDVPDVLPRINRERLQSLLLAS
ncbi:MAG TPA: SEC-C metal-binding domain-containing protein [Baekduia sp.]|uniref:YecA family protein n=1 Tax=Baekduia sp. TaxID=2600305 RepID=UPI002C14BBD4|nr:SEC-C metal-binding domain-containing protein [Baekduia sp.]HMJ32416.1 SEC-C metal-binding domain-containing protein [Baekduia sp.]